MFFLVDGVCLVSFHSLQQDSIILLFVTIVFNRVRVQIYDQYILMLYIFKFCCRLKKLSEKLSKFNRT